MSRDPFPMSSTLAKEMEASMEGDSNQLTEWGSMSTRSAQESPSGGDGAVESSSDAKAMGNDDLGANSAGESLTGKSKRMGVDDIYADIDRINPLDKDDSFFDVPLTESRSNVSYMERAMYSFLRYCKKLYAHLYGNDLPLSEMIRTLCLASTLFFMIGGYWLLRSLKDPVITALCGVKAIPRAKMVSVVVVLAVVSIYNQLLDSSIPRHKLFYIFGTFYFALFTIIALLLKDETIGLDNQQPDPWRLLGWISYCSIESFGSVMVSLFWSFANSNFSLQTAKASYGVMVATAQLGSILGPAIVNQYTATWGVANCYLIGASCMIMLQGTMHLYIRTYGAEERNTSSKQQKPKAGILEGLQLFWDHNYVKGIFAISCLFMVEVTIVDFTMKVLARDYYAGLHPCEENMSCWDAKDGDHGMSEDATASFTTFMGLFGLLTNALSFFLSLLGTSAVIRYLGLRLTLLLFPTLCLGVIICVRLMPTLVVVFAAMMVLKASSYALNNPTKEILYQPTSSAVRYKAKSWIDIFGARGSKALGSVVTDAFSDSAKNLVANGSLVGMMVASFLIWNARYMGRKFDEYMQSGFIVGEDDVVRATAIEGDGNLEMAINQNEQADTSCAVYEEEEEEDGADDMHADNSESEPVAKVSLV